MDKDERYIEAHLGHENPFRVPDHYFEDFAKQLKVYNRRDYNNFPMHPLGWKTPNQVLKDYLSSV